MIEFEEHPGPLLRGDLIVIEIDGKIVPRRPDDARPQWFMVNEDQGLGDAISLTAISAKPIGLAVRKYKCGWNA